MKLVINRKEWRRGPQDASIVLADPTSLLCKDGTKCCLGFYALQCGYSPDRIKGIGEPNDIGLEYAEELPKDFEKLVELYEDEDEETGYMRLRMRDTKLTGEAIGINDATYTDEADREADLIKAFAQEGIEVEFNG